MVNVRELTFVLSTKSFEHIGVINNVDVESIDYIANLNSADELSLDVHKYLDGIVEALWDVIVPLKLIYVPELGEHGEYFQIDPNLNDNRQSVVKTLTCTSLCEAELGQIIVRDLNINNEDDINWREDDNDWTDDVTLFYKPNAPKYSLLNRLLDKAPHYSIGHVDDSLKDLMRQFSFDNGDIYGILTGEVSEQFNCIFLFDSTTRTINAYDLYSTCTTCGYRGEFTDEFVCPECGSDHRTYFGEDTTIYIDKENLTDDIQFETDTNSIKNCFKLEAGDEFMTSAVIAQNPNGSQYIYYLSKDTLNDMPKELVDALGEYDELYDYYQNDVVINLNTTDINRVIAQYKAQYDEQFRDDEITLDLISSSIKGYPQLMLVDYEMQDLYYYVRSSMMPNVEIPDTNATTEAAKLTVPRLSPVALSSVTNSTSSTTVESALKNYAKVYVRTGFVSVTPITVSLSAEASIDGDGNKYKMWSGYFKVANYSDEEDVKFACSTGVVSSNDDAYSRPMSIKVYDKYDDFMKQKIIKSIKSDDDDDNTVFNILNYIIYDDYFHIVEDKVRAFTNAVSLYGLERVKSFKDAFQTALDVLIEAGQKDNPLYSIYYKKMNICQTRVDELSADLDVVEHFKEVVDTQRMSIQKLLEFQSFLGEDLYKIYSMYRREDEYTNTNFISDARSDADVFKLAKEFLDEANKQLKIAATPQHSISANLFNLLQIPEFEALRTYFRLGNFLRVKVDDNVYRLRLIKWELTGSDDKMLPVEFSDVTYAPGIANDLKSLLNSTKSMATTFNYVSKQADEGSKAHTRVDDWIRDGLNSALVTINNNNNQEITIDQHGILARSYDIDTERYSPEQLRITGNILAFTQDNWESIQLCLGKANYMYYDKQTDEWYQDEGFGLISQFSQQSWISGSTIVGGEIYSDNYSATEQTGCYINLETGDFSLAGGILTYNNETNEFVIDYSKSGIRREIDDALSGIDVDLDEVYLGKNLLGYTNTFNKWLMYDSYNEDGVRHLRQYDAFKNYKTRTELAEEEPSDDEENASAYEIFEEISIVDDTFSMDVPQDDPITNCRLIGWAGGDTVSIHRGRNMVLSFDMYCDDWDNVSEGLDGFDVTLFTTNSTPWSGNYSISKYKTAKLSDTEFFQPFEQLNRQWITVVSNVFIYDPDTWSGGYTPPSSTVPGGTNPGMGGGFLGVKALGELVLGQGAGYSNPNFLDDDKTARLDSLILGGDTGFVPDTPSDMDIPVSDGDQYLGLYFNLLSHGNIKIRHPKLEIGTRNTLWVANADDLAIDHNSIKDAIETTVAKYTFGKDAFEAEFRQFKDNFDEKIRLGIDGVTISSNAKGTSVNIDDDSITFRTAQSDEDVATITNTDMRITKGFFTQQLRIGAFAFIPRIKSDGTFGNLRFVKVSDALLDIGVLPEGDIIIDDSVVIDPPNDISVIDESDTEQE